MALTLRRFILALSLTVAFAGCTASAGPSDKTFTGPNVQKLDRLKVGQSARIGGDVVTKTADGGFTVKAGK
jgi:starvation-inducible outer membrane lipoprotein